MKHWKIIVNKYSEKREVKREKTLSVKIKKQPNSLTLKQRLFLQPSFLHHTFVFISLTNYCSFRYRGKGIPSLVREGKDGF